MVSCATTVVKTHQDVDLERRVTNFLHGRHIASLRTLQVEALAGTVKLSGRVNTFYEKQLGHTLAQHVAGVLRLVDEVEVARR